MARLSGPPIDPPNYRKGNDKSHCGNCKMFNRGKCWGYGNHPVEAEGVCDSWSKETRKSNVIYIPSEHYNPFTGLPCKCNYGRQKIPRRHASQAVRAIRNQNQKAFRTEEGQRYLSALEQMAGEFDLESMIPWFAQQYKKKQFFLHPDEGTLHWYPYGHQGFEDQVNQHGQPAAHVPHHRPIGASFLSWNQWMNARQHPLRRGVNIMEKTPTEVNELSSQLRAEIAEKEKTKNWFGNHPDNGTHVFTFDPSMASEQEYHPDGTEMDMADSRHSLLSKYRGWQVHRLDDEDHAEAESAALGHCIGSDDQNYKRAIQNGDILAYSLRDPKGYPHVTWHFNPDETLAHIQGRSGYPSEDYRDLISLFNEHHHLDDDDGGRGEEQQLPGAETYGDARIQLPDPSTPEEYVGQFHPEADTHELALYHGNMGEDTEIDKGDPDWWNIYENLRENPDAEDRNNFYNTILYNQHHDAFQKGMDEWRKYTNDLGPIDQQLQQEWTQAENRSYDPQTGAFVPPRSGLWGPEGPRWETAWDATNTPLFQQQPTGDYWYQNGEEFPSNTPGIWPASQQTALNIQRARQGNILDPVHDTLPPLVWDNPGSERPHLKDAHRKWIMREIYELASQFEPDADAWLTLVLTGSLTTYQYSDISDCDISLFIDPFKLPEWDRAKLIGLMITHMDGTKLPGTPYELQDFVVAKNISTADLYQPGLRSGYDIRSQTWIVPPDHSRTHNVQREQNTDYVYALESADKMERLLRYEPAKAVQFWHQIHRRRMRDQRAGKGDFSQANIVYKFLANRGLFPEISQASGEYIA